MSNALELRVKRTDCTVRSTIGEFDIDGAPFCYTLEDVVRPAGVKVKGETAIPAGRYRVRNTYSPKFRRVMPQIMEVPMFDGIRIHGGNSSADTEGCLLLGMHRGRDHIDTCAPALEHVYTLITGAEAAGREVWITIEDVNREAGNA